MMKIEDILNDLVEVNTVNDKNNNIIVNYIEKYLSDLGFKTEYKTKCLVMSIGNNPIVSFIGHTDVVDSGKDWSYPIFKLTKQKNKLIGRGVSDMKGGIAAFLYTLSQIDLTKIKKGIRICLTYDEEKEFKGIKELVKNNIDFGEYSIIGEPTDNYPCVGSKGLLEYELIFKGKAVHSSVPIENECSNEKSVMFLSQILKLNNKFKKDKCDLFEVPYNTINIGTINGGTDIVTTSDYTKVLLGFRITKNEKDIDYIKKYINNLSKKIKVEKRIINEIKPFYNYSNIINYCEKITNKKSKPFFGLTDASFLNNNRIIIGPGPVTAHQKDEYILKSSLYESSKIYKKIIEKICF